MISSSLEAGREGPTEKEVVVSINHHLVLELAEMQVKGGHHKLFRETERGDFL